jgi:hypothetical protein
VWPEQRFPCSEGDADVSTAVTSQQASWQQHRKQKHGFWFGRTGEGEGGTPDGITPDRSVLFRACDVAVLHRMLFKDASDNTLNVYYRKTQFESRTNLCGIILRNIPRPRPSKSLLTRHSWSSFDLIICLQLKLRQTAGYISDYLDNKFLSWLTVYSTAVTTGCSI